MYRDDDAARAERANALIDEIAELERKKVEQAATEQRLTAARDELRTLQATPAAAPPVERMPGAGAHVVVFGATAMATYLGYLLLF
jgi:hypothetical protein